jgi:phosphoadenosine phosphosulfate reductase
MALWRDGGFAEDSWKTLDDAEPIPPTGAIILSFARWSAERDALSARADPVGVSVPAGPQAPAQLAEAAHRPLVALSFAKFADGRAFSYGELLRERFGFTGELRATGDVLLDEIPLMERCGFTAFEVTDAPTLRALREGHVPGGKLHYQPSVALGEAPAGTRPWLRKAAPLPPSRGKVSREA